LGRYPQSPGATGNVATEDVVYALEGEGYDTGLLSLPDTPASASSKEAGDAFDAARMDGLIKLAEVGQWVSDELGRTNASRAGKAALAYRERKRRETADAKAKL
jgi:hydroxymethylglutaryl-CoA lyase